jgi:hypothetical protein
MGCNLMQCEKEHQELNAALVASGIPDTPPNDFHSQISIHICPGCNDIFCGQHMTAVLLNADETDIDGYKELIPGIQSKLSQSRCNDCWKNGTKWIIKKT